MNMSSKNPKDTIEKNIDWYQEGIKIKEKSLWTRVSNTRNTHSTDILITDDPKHRELNILQIVRDFYASPTSVLSLCLINVGKANCLPGFIHATKTQTHISLKCCTFTHVRFKVVSDLWRTGFGHGQILRLQQSEPTSPKGERKRQAI